MRWMLITLLQFLYPMTLTFYIEDHSHLSLLLGSENCYERLLLHKIVMLFWWLYKRHAARHMDRQTGGGDIQTKRQTEITQHRQTPRHQNGQNDRHECSMVAVE